MIHRRLETATADAIERLQEHRENKRHAPHNASISAYKDARATLTGVEEQACILDVLIILQRVPKVMTSLFFFRKFPNK